MDLVYLRKNVKVGYLVGQRYIALFLTEMVPLISSGMQKRMSFSVG